MHIKQKFISVLAFAAAATCLAAAPANAQYCGAYGCADVGASLGFSINASIGAVATTAAYAGDAVYGDAGYAPRYAYPHTYRGRRLARAHYVAQAVYAAPESYLIEDRGCRVRHPVTDRYGFVIGYRDFYEAC